jgi:hypothetical protein
MSQRICFSLREWQKIFKDLKKFLIVQASAKDGSDSWQPFPIGMSWQYILNEKKGHVIQIGNHEHLVLCAVKPGTDNRRRPNGINRISIINTLKNNSIENELLEHEHYFDSLPNYKFVISPEGNGIDCHRHYEALLAGCVPIVEYNCEIEKKYEGCPILYTHDYSEISEEYLNKKYIEMLDTMYDFSRLFLLFYDEETVNTIIDNGNYWCKILLDIEWYV